MKKFFVVCIYLGVLVFAIVLPALRNRSGRKRTVARFFDLLRRSVLRNEHSEQQRWLDAFIAGQPKVVRDFFYKDFQPANEEEKALFLRMQEEIATGNTTFDDHHAVFAKIGGADLLKYLYGLHYRNTPENNDIRKNALENPRCFESLFLSGLNDSDWEVRKAAVLNPNCPKRYIKGIYQTETNPVVRAAIEKRMRD